MFSPNFYVNYNNIKDPSKPKDLREKNYHLSNQSRGNENVLLNPSINSNIILIYENESDLDNAIATYLNEGLRRGHVCVHASVSLANEGYMENFSSRIVNYQENLENGNLKLVDLTTYYVNAMVSNLESFDKLKEEIISFIKRDKNRINKHVRVTEDCATLLLKNKHLEQCILVNEWCRRNPLEGSYVCPYPKSSLNQFPYNAYISRILHDRDIIIDSNGKLISKFI